MPPCASMRDRAAERERRRDAVFEAAAAAFSENGYHKTSLDDIARRLTVTKPALYYYAKSKEDLIVAVVDRALEHILVDMPGDPHVSGHDRLCLFLCNYAKIAASDFGRCLIRLRDTDLSAQAGAHLRACKAMVDEKIRDMIVSGMADGSIAKCDPQLTAFVLAGAIDGISRLPCERDEPDSVMAICLHQLGIGLLPRD